jgi:hypothetical protein
LSIQLHFPFSSKPPLPQSLFETLKLLKNI